MKAIITVLFALFLACILSAQSDVVTMRSGDVLVGEVFPSKQSAFIAFLLENAFDTLELDVNHIEKIVLEATSASPDVQNPVLNLRNFATTDFYTNIMLAKFWRLTDNLYGGPSLTYLNRSFATRWLFSANLRYCFLNKDNFRIYAEGDIGYSITSGLWENSVIPGVGIGLVTGASQQKVNFNSGIRVRSNTSQDKQLLSWLSSSLEAEGWFLKSPLMPEVYVGVMF